jgi:hypothetical protein
MVDLYFGPDYVTRRTDTPLRTDKQFDIEISNDIPATTAELKSLVQKYNGSYLSIYGAISHVTTASCPDICNAMSRLGVFQAAPSKLGFDSLHRLMMYLKTHPNVPLFYPNKPLTSTSMFETFTSKGDIKHRLAVPHCLCSHVDSSFAPHEDRHSVSGHVETIGTVAIDWKTEKQVTCASSSSDSEVRSYYSGGKRTIKKRRFLQQIGLLLHKPTPLLTTLTTAHTQPTTVFEDNSGTSMMFNSGRVTSNLKHVDLPLQYMHDIHERGILQCIQCSTHVQWADTFTKQAPGPLHLNHRGWYMGRRFHPPVGTEHYKLLTNSVPLSY